MIEVLSKVSPSEMIEAKQADLTIGQVVWWVKTDNKPKLSRIRKTKSKSVRKYVHQFDHVEFRKGSASLNL